MERDLLARREQISRAELEEAQVQGRAGGADRDGAPRAGLRARVARGRRMPAAARRARAPRAVPGSWSGSCGSWAPVNPLALEEYAALEERHEFLEGQLHDVSAARRELGKVIKAVDAEIITVFKAAYDDVAENFASS